LRGKGEFELDIFLEYFFQRALIGGAMIGLMAPLLGIFVVLRRLSMIGDTLAHVSIAGVALGLLLGIYPLLMGMIFAVIAALAIEKLRTAYKTYAELSIVIIMTSGVAVAAFLFTLGKGFNVNVMSYLFGSIYTLSTQDLWLIFVVTLLVIGFVIMSYKEMFLVVFDEDAASVNGLPLRLFNLAITMLTALVIAVAIKIVGALLVSALLTIPVASSLVIGRSFKHSIILAVIISEFAVLTGLISAGYWNLAPGATVVITLLFVLMVCLVMRRGLRIT